MLGFAPLAAAPLGDDGVAVATVITGTASGAQACGADHRGAGGEQRADAGTGGIAIPAAMVGVPLFPTGSVQKPGNDQITARFLAASMGFGIPSGFTAWGV